MLEQGRVSRVEKNLALVEFGASAACTKCGACHAAASGKMTLEAENLVGAQVGDRVMVEVSFNSQMLFPLLLFGVPLLFLLLGLLLGSLVSEIMSIVLGVIFLLLGFLSLRLADQHVTKAKKFTNRIVRKLREGKLAFVETLADKEVRAMAKDLVCGMEVEEGKICSEYEGKKYCFCSDACKATFEQDPKKYIQQTEGKEKKGCC